MITPPAKRFTTVNGHRLARVIAPDLIGHGDSDKLPASLGPGGLHAGGRLRVTGRPAGLPRW